MNFWNIPIPKALVYVVLIIVFLAMIPPALIARTRATHRKLPRIQLVQDMGAQHRFNAQDGNSLFRDGRAMRPRIAGTVAREDYVEDEHYHFGIVDDNWAADFPSQVVVDRRLLERGRERYDIYCSVCHGAAGFGDGMIDRRARELMESPMAISQGTTWVQPTSMHDQMVIEQPNGQLFNTISNGIRNMPAYGPQIPVDDRWAIVAYIRALQMSQGAGDNIESSQSAASHVPAGNDQQETALLAHGRQQVADSQQEVTR